MHSTGLITPVRNSEKVASIVIDLRLSSGHSSCGGESKKFESHHLCGVTAVVAEPASLTHPELASNGFSKEPIASAYIAAPLRLGCPTAARRQRTRRSSRIILSSGDSRTGRGQSCLHSSSR